MKKFKFSYLVSCLMVMTLCVGFASCSEDDETKGNGEIKSSSLVGTWQCTWNKGYLHEQEFEEDYEEWDEAITDLVVTFNSNGTGVFEEDGYSEPFTWVIAGNKLTMYSNEYDDEGTNADYWCPVKLFDEFSLYKFTGQPMS